MPERDSGITEGMHNPHMPGKLHGIPENGVDSGVPSPSSSCSNDLLCLAAFPPLPSSLDQATAQLTTITISNGTSAKPSVVVSLHNEKDSRRQQTKYRASQQATDLSRVVHAVYDAVRVDASLLTRMEQTVSRLHSMFRTNMGDCRLDVYGSMLNGFGTGCSDIDLCFRLADKDGTAVEKRPSEGSLIAKLEELLRGEESVTRVEPILAARVPIVKFEVDGFDADISYYNVLALYNTEMLAAYCRWDERVAPLGVFIKQWARANDICDASKGSLSSYAYILLLVHYLHIERVVPCLQEDFGVPASRKVEDEWETGFHEHVRVGWSRNGKSVGELLVGFFHYYIQFDWEREVVCVRTRSDVTRRAKRWEGSFMCIEDPFELQHNLAARCSQAMRSYIIRCMCNTLGRLIAETPGMNFICEGQATGIKLANEVVMRLTLPPWDKPPVERPSKGRRSRLSSMSSSISSDGFSLPSVPMPFNPSSFVRGSFHFPPHGSALRGPAPSRVVYLWNIPDHMEEVAVLSVYAAYGAIINYSVWIGGNAASKQALIEYAHPQSAHRVVSSWVQIRGFSISAQYSQYQKIPLCDAVQQERKRRNIVYSARLATYAL